MPAAIVAAVVVLLIAGLGYRAATRSEPETQPQSVTTSGGGSGAAETLVAGASSGETQAQPATGTPASPQQAESPPADFDESAPDPDKPELKQRMAQALVTRARQDAAQGNYDAAIRKLERAARLDPQSADVQEALRRARRARKTELEVLRRRK